MARIEEECSALERRMRDLSITQQRSLLENLANASSAVIGGLLVGHGEAYRPAEGKRSERWRTAEGEGEPSLCK